MTIAAPDAVAARAAEVLRELRQRPDVAAALDAAPRELRDAVPCVFAASDFVADACLHDAELLPALLGGGLLLAPRGAADYAVAAASADPHADEAQFQSWLRRWRRREMVRIAWRDLAGWAGVEATLAELSAFADTAVSLACAFAQAQLAARYGTPRGADGSAQPLVVLGMGKLGGRELNFSSDIDLVFLFPEFGETDGARPVANEEFFTRVGQTMIRLLDAPTADGFVFRTDMRLRPFGDSGPLVAGFSSFEDYLLRHGRAWERYAYVKARALTAPDAYVELQRNVVRPFVYRRYIDYGVFESLREMKGLIEREVQRRDLGGNIKLGRGGIREIEFIVQALQLVRGGQDRRLQTPSLLEALGVLEGSRMLPRGAVAELRAAYLFLRRLENRLQMLQDRQIHELPADATSRARIAFAMGEPGWAALAAVLDAHRACVTAHFRAIVFAPQAEAAKPVITVDLGPLWDDGSGADNGLMERTLAEAGLGEPAEAARLLVEFRVAIERRLDAAGRKRVRALMPQVVADIAAAGGTPEILRRVLRVFEAIGPRSVYFALLHESPVARRRLVDLCAHGDFLAAQMAAHPLLLDELIDDRLLEALPDRAALAAELELRLGQLADDDPERQVEALCHFKRAAVFRIAVADLTGRVPVMRVSDRLTDVAELIVEQAMTLAWRQIVAQFGAPLCGEGDARRAVQVCAVGYGKLGGIELGYGSDLDLVFLHDSAGEAQETGGAKPIDNQVFFVRLAQRIVHLLTMHSPAGRLYEVDMRLRPSGKGGMLVTSIAAFADYQRSDAWTWEHQALLHARAVAGAPRLRAAFEELRVELLRDAVRRDTLRDDVRAMRERMRRELSRAGAGQVDLKQDPGGIADIEFLAQYWALRWAGEHPPVAFYSDTIRQLESVASADLVPQATVDILTRAYRLYRERIHHRALADAPPIVAEGEFAAERAAVVAVWNAAMGGVQTGGI
ncbi:MAG: bifunctional [glutamate--ammonia ligase]-adenylyl-L-tyrosine phosphorylase/[glutamate--ammonia-ligase] adenylyltransferase [Steroidobacteraceae bacterium]|nr:bifunctional [glutamate--ammonia ligase]-adenylyl-L-tyrosine phosphorylase/[glutamate--ammonia-ligase] adenylyltransferase [Steroidobacteraceae bacterium]MCW5573168.1 bifunctional [glutamate--ammonia ligase]-adenylyl-L-tyrosine phosphorylase/[glutamate--ammonia-ligase] adenylyltransferase [Steroidobacteraceae bacterium]